MSNEPAQQSSVGQRDFKYLFCQYYDCPLEQFEEELFRKCLYPHAVPIAPFIRRLMPAVFRPDFELIKHVSTTSSLAELQQELNISSWYVPPSGFWRRTMNVRMSLRLLLNAGQQLLNRSGLTG